MKRSGFFDCLTLDQAQQPAVNLNSLAINQPSLMQRRK